MSVQAAQLLRGSTLAAAGLRSSTECSYWWPLLLRDSLYTCGTHSPIETRAAKLVGSARYDRVRVALRCWLRQWFGLALARQLDANCSLHSVSANGRLQQQAFGRQTACQRWQLRGNIPASTTSRPGQRPWGSDPSYRGTGRRVPGCPSCHHPRPQGER